MSHINIKNLSVAYGNHPVLKKISLTIPDKNQIIVIIGPSGCGKTTLLKSINRLLDLNEDVKVSGDINIDGMNVYDSSLDILALRKKVGFLSQRPYPLPMSIYNNVAFVARIHRLSKMDIINQLETIEKYNPLLESTVRAARRKNGKKRNSEMDLFVEYYLRLAGLWDEVKNRLDSPATGLSIGQQQRLALARSLAVKPELILADEPTSSLDPVSAQLVETQFKKLKDNYSIIIVTHILRQAVRIADYAIFLYLGELVEHGPADQIFKSPKDERTKAYVQGQFS